MREAFSTSTDFPLCKCSLSTVHVSETKPLLAWCFPYEILDPIFLLPSAFLLSILNYSQSSCSRLQMSEMFSSKQHKFSRLTGEAKRKKRKKKNNPDKNYLVLFTSSEQAASSAGLAHFKSLHRKRTMPLSHSAHPAPRDAGHLQSRIQQEARGANAGRLHWLQTSTAPHWQQLSKGEGGHQQLPGDKEHCDCTAFVHLVYQQALPRLALRKGEHR